MSRPADNIVKLSETLTLAEFKSGGSLGFWLYDKTRGFNLAMRAKSETAALVEALQYYQKTLLIIEHEHRELTKKVDAFVSQFVTDTSIEE